MKTIEAFYRELTDAEIEIAFLESEDWRKTGVLQDGVLRGIYNDFCEENGVNGGLIHVIVEPLLREMVLRYRKEAAHEQAL